MTISDFIWKGTDFCSFDNPICSKPALWPALMYNVEFLCFANIGMSIKDLFWMVHGNRPVSKAATCAWYA